MLTSDDLHPHPRSLLYVRMQSNVHAPLLRDEIGAAGIVLFFCRRGRCVRLSQR